APARQIGYAANREASELGRSPGKSLLGKAIACRPKALTVQEPMHGILYIHAVQAARRSHAGVGHRDAVAWRIGAQVREPGARGRCSCSLGWKALGNLRTLCLSAR